MHQGKGIEDDAVADDRLRLLAQDSAGNQLEDKLFAGDGDGMPGVVSAGIACNHFEIIRKDIDDLALALITPLGSENHRGLYFAHSDLQTHADGLRKSRTQTYVLKVSGGEAGKESRSGCVQQILTGFAAQSKAEGEKRLDQADESGIAWVSFGGIPSFLQFRELRWSTLCVMPELPEVETIARGLDKRLAGDRIEEVWIGDKSNLLKSPASEIARVLRGSRIEGFRRVGKHIVGELASAKGPAQWVIHLGHDGALRGVRA